jgi:ribosomal protein S18 acetylase RimI-like enzyme
MKDGSLPGNGFRTGMLVVELIVRHAFAHGEVWSALAGRGVSVWFHRNAALPDIDGYSDRLAEIRGRHLARFEALDKAFADHHPSEPHHHLAFLAVQPALRNHKIGSTLLDHHLRHLDKRGIPAYLEAADERSQGLYLRHGFINHGPPFQLPDGPSMYPMWRSPRRGTGDR